MAMNSRLTRTNTVREGGFEPPRPCGHWHLKPARLPFRHSRSIRLRPRGARTSRERLARLARAPRADSRAPPARRIRSISRNLSERRDMGILERFEKKVEGAVSAAFARTFK